MLLKGSTAAGYNMNKEEAQLLINKYLQGKADARERALVERWYQQKADEQQLSEDDDFEHLAVELWEGTKQKAGIGSKKPVQLWPRILMAAAAVAAIVFGVWFYTGRPIENDNPQIVLQNDIAPGKNTATLTLGNGKAIQLSDAQTGVVVGTDLKYNDGTAVQRGDPDLRKYNANLTLTTPKGGQYQITLPDGSKVWLNAASSLTYATSLNERGERRVKLSGEAYFDIAKDKKHPFIVESSGQEVKVLGTQFNINSYDNEPVTKTTLLEGSVEISNKRGAKLLVPGCEAVASDEGIELNKVNTELAVAWKNKQFMFESENIQAIMRMVERWYDVEVIYTGQIPTETFSGGVSRYDNISELLNTLASTGKVKFKIAGRKVYVSM